MDGGQPVNGHIGLNDLSKPALDARSAAIKDTKHLPFSENAARYLERLRARRPPDGGARQAPTPLRILISGGGICGLSTSIALSRQGHNVTVLEAAEEIGAIGAGIQIAPNASRQLFKWGVEDELAKLIVHPKHLMTRRWSDGKAVGILRTRELYGKYGSPFVQIHRGDLHRALYNIAERGGVSFRTNAKVVKYDFEATYLTLDSGEKLSADLIIAADGVRSAARHQLDPNNFTPPSTAEYVAYRAPLPVEAVLADPSLRWTVDEPHQNCWAGPDRHAQTYSMHGNEQLNMVFIAPMPLDDTMRSPQAEWKAELAAHFAGWDPALIRLIDKADPIKVGKWPIWSAPHLKTWSSGNGRSVLVMGDAAHDMTPYLGQGAAQAIEDAALLGELLIDIGGDPVDATGAGTSDSSSDVGSDIAAAIELLQAFRKPRTSMIRRLAEANFRTWQMPDGDAQQERDRLAAVEFDSPHVEQSPYVFTDAVGQQWLYGTDVTEDIYNLMR